MILTIEKHEVDTQIPDTDTIYSMCEHYIVELGLSNYECMLAIILHDEEIPDGMWGYCDWDPQEQLAEVHLALRGPAWGLTLAHEMVHVQQNLMFGVTAEGPAYEQEYELYSSWKRQNEPTR